MAESSDDEWPPRFQDHELVEFMNYIAARCNDADAENSSSGSDSSLLQSDSDDDSDRDSLAIALYTSAALLRTRTTPSEDEEAQVSGNQVAQVEDVLSDQVVEVDQGTCEGHKLKIEFTVKVNCDANTATLDPSSTRTALKITLPSSMASDKVALSQPLHWACQKGHVDIIRILLDHGACFHSQCWLGSVTPYFLACDNGHVEAIRMLLAHERGSSECHNDDEIDNLETIVKNHDKWGNTALHLACRNGHIEVANVLLAHGARVDVENCFSQLPLHLACRSGSVELVNILLARGGPGTVFATSEFGESALHYACREGNVEIAEALVASGACVEHSDTAGIKPIHEAIRSGNVDSVEYLLSVGADVNAADDFKQTPLHYACHFDKSAVVDALLAHGATVDAPDNLGKTPLHWASEKGPVAVAKSLLASGASCNLKDKQRRTPLHCIGESSYHYLIMAGSRSLLHRCSSIGESSRLDHATIDELTRALLIHGADVHVKYNGHSVLERRSVVSPSKCCSTILLEYGIGTGGPCRRTHACGRNELACMLLSLPTVVLKGFAKYLCKTEAAGLDLPGDAKAAETRSLEVWTQSGKDVFRAKCLAELEKLKVDLIPNTTVTYFDLLSRNISAMWGQEIIRNFDPYSCVQTYPIYGDMIGCSFAKLRRFLLVDNTYAFFFILEPKLPPECAEEVQRYLSDRDLFNMLDICRRRPRTGSAAHEDDEVTENNKRSAEMDVGECSTSSPRKKTCPQME